MAALPHRNCIPWTSRRIGAALRKHHRCYKYLLVFSLSVPPCATVLGCPGDGKESDDEKSDADEKKSKVMPPRITASTKQQINWILSTSGGTRGGGIFCTHTHTF